MPGTSAGAAKRVRCATCGAWHSDSECPKTGAKRRLTDEQRRANAAEYHRGWNARNPDRRRALAVAYRRRLKADVLTHYSLADVPECACCQERTFEFLTLDHVENNGAEARRKAGNKGGFQYYRKLRANGYPEGYQVLCWNCNLAKALYGECPHVSDKVYDFSQ